MLLPDYAQSSSNDSEKRRFIQVCTIADGLMKKVIADQRLTMPTQVLEAAYIK